THAEPLPAFASRYGQRQPFVAPLLQAFGPEALLDWAHKLGIETFTGSSQRIFPVGKKAAPLLRAWLQRLRASGVRMHLRHRWLGWRDGALLFATPQGEVRHQADACVLALGGASWPQLGSDGSWVQLLEQQQIRVTP